MNDRTKQHSRPDEKRINGERFNYSASPLRGGNQKASQLSKRDVVPAEDWFYE